jgi:two-component system chemotaxis response regulator CheB
MRQEGAGAPNPDYFVAIGASGAEGLDDIIEILQGLAKPSKAIVLVVLHRAADKTSNLRRIIARYCDMPVAIAGEAERFVRGTCYIGEPDGHLTLVERHIAHLVPGKGHRLRNRTVDILFDSIAEHARHRAIGIVLSGSLDDGSSGLAAIHEAGGLTMVLRPGSKLRGMQQNAIDYDGPIDFIGTAAGIAARIDEVIAVDL